MIRSKRAGERSMDEVHELSRADKMAKDIADILARLVALERKIDAINKAVVSGAVRSKAETRQSGRKKDVRGQKQKKKTKP
jgi:hypothetical protein